MHLPSLSFLSMGSCWQRSQGDAARSWRQDDICDPFHANLASVKAPPILMTRSVACGALQQQRLNSVQCAFIAAASQGDQSVEFCTGTLTEQM